MSVIKHREKLPITVKLSLFISSYIPLFLIVILRQVEQNFSYLNFGGINYQALKLFLSKFGVSTFLACISIYGLIGLCFFIKNMSKLTEDNGHKLGINRIQNKNAESIGYVATYLLPFVFQTYSSVFDVLQIIILLSVMYIIYTHSNLIVVNPLLNLWYSLYEIEYYNVKAPEIKQNGIFIINCHYLEKNDVLYAKKITNTYLFYGRIKETNE